MPQTDPTLRYYESLLHYLRSAGREFAAAHPDRARSLGLSRDRAEDPAVERLFEGMAFLMGRVEQRLDDDLPELTEGLVNMLWPQYLRMIPSLTVVKLVAQRNTLQHNEMIQAGLQIQSLPIIRKEGNLSCLYRTTQAVQLMPLVLQNARIEQDGSGRSRICFDFLIEAQAKRDTLDLSRLRLFFSAPDPVAFTLRHVLLNDVLKAEVRCDGQIMMNMPIHTEEVGLSKEERLWPHLPNGFDGYRLLLEYFCFRRKFCFVDVCGFDILQLSENKSQFSIEITLTHPYPSEKYFDTDDVHLYCTPAINLFDLETEPIRVNHMQSEYLVKPLLHEGMQVEVYSVDEVHAFDHINGQRHEYLPFTSFQHRGGMLHKDAPERYFHARIKQSVSGHHEVMLMLGGHDWQQQTFSGETLSLKATGSNGALPRHTLSAMQINDTHTGEPNLARVYNVVPATEPFYPPTEDRFQWRILSHLAPNYLSMLNKERLQGVLSIYDWTEGELNRRKIEAITDVNSKMIQRMQQGCVHRGVEIEVAINSAAFSGEEEVYLFGTLLNKFFATYADVNLFTRLRLISLPSQKEYQWSDSKAVTAGF